MKTISHSIMLENGYKEYETNKYQKKITDNKGTRYFINCSYNDFDGRIEPWWTFSVQFETKYGSVDIQTVQWFNGDGKYSSNTIKDVEDYYEDMWRATGKYYYY